MAQGLFALGFSRECALARRSAFLHSLWLSLAKRQVGFC
jgi:hypothetical protein